MKFNNAISTLDNNVWFRKQDDEFSVEINDQNRRIYSSCFEVRAARSAEVGCFFIESSGMALGLSAALERSSVCPWRENIWFLARLDSKGFIIITCQFPAKQILLDDTKLCKLVVFSSVYRSLFHLYFDRSDLFCSWRWMHPQDRAESSWLIWTE